MIEQLLYKLLEQTPVIIVLGVGIYVLWNKLNEKEKEAISERKAHKKDIRELVDSHSKEVRDLNQLIREHEREHLTALDALTDAIESMNDKT